MFGKYFGFPKCCRKAFGKDDGHFKLRHKAGELNGIGTGFVPCTWHAKLVLAGKVRLQDLIKDRICPHSFPEDGLQYRIDAEEILVKYARELT
jgi:hypothetical protein